MRFMKLIEDTQELFELICELVDIGLIPVSFISFLIEKYKETYE